MREGDQQSSGLRRSISRWEIVGLGINDIIGSGVYLLPAAAAALLGGASTLAVLLAGLAVALLVLCFAEAASHFDEPGGGYIYTREAFGPFVGFQVGWMTWLARIASIASLSNGLALATAYVWPAASSGAARVLVITLPLILLTWINVVGVKAGARTAVGLVIAKTLPLVLFVGIGIFAMDWSRVSLLEKPPVANLGQAALLLLFAYAGFENTPAAAGEYRNPKKDVPIAMLVVIAFVTVIYSLVQLISIGTLPGLAQAEAPLAEAARLFLGGGAALVMTVGAIISILGNISNTILVGPRYLFALAVDGYGPRALAGVHPRYQTPAVAIITQSTLSLVLALSGSFVQLAMLSVIARLATYMGTAAAVPFLRRRFPPEPGQPPGFRLPGGPTIPIAALALSVAFLTSATWQNLLAGAIALAVGAAIYVLTRRATRPRPSHDRP
jgi:basic amino acid/polyamine antiporter, APA family